MIYITKYSPGLPCFIKEIKRIFEKELIANHNLEMILIDTASSIFSNCISLCLLFGYCVGSLQIHYFGFRNGIFWQSLILVFFTMIYLKLVIFRKK
jgi:ABC-type multidrug transport system permease subunit